MLNKKQFMNKSDSWQKVFLKDDMIHLSTRLLKFIKRLERVDKAWSTNVKIWCANIETNEVTTNLHVIVYSMSVVKIILFLQLRMI